VPKWLAIIRVREDPTWGLVRLLYQIFLLGWTMNTSLRVGWALRLCLAGMVLSGCTVNSSGTLPVTGKVTQGGQPVSGAAVTFVPTATDGKAASGTTDGSGIYKLTTLVNGDGAIPGSYTVIITKFPGAASTPGVSSGTTATPADMDAAYKAMEKQGQNVLAPQNNMAPSASQNELADKFANAATSGLTAEVKAGGANTFDFEVTGK